MIRLEHVRKEYPGVTPLSDVCAEIQNGDVISIIGPSGSGKSTLLRCINMLEIPTSGHIYLDGMDITAPGCNLTKVRQRMGMVFQNFNLFSHLSVIENIMLAPIDLLGYSKQQAYDKGMELLKMTGLAKKARSYPNELSGGQKQRVAIARTLAMEPEFILFDEPTSALDPAMIGEVQAVIRELSRMGTTMMIVTHEPDFAQSICNRVFYMDEGGIYEEGTPEEIFLRPKRDKTRRFIKRLQTLEISIDKKEYDFAAIEGKIDAYCQKHHLSLKMKTRLEMVFEELVHQLLIVTQASPRIQMAIEHPQKQDICNVTVRYAGEPFNVLQKGDDLSIKMLEGLSTEIHYAWEEEEEYPNLITLSLRP